MKALCVRQPWAWLLFHGKPVENRDWFTAYRGPLVIVASKGMTIGEYEDARDFVCTFDPELCRQIPDRKSLVYGRAVGVVRQTGCVTDHPSPWFQGKFGHVYADAREFEHPVPVMGRLGLFEWDPRWSEMSFADLNLLGTAYLEVH